VSFVFSMILMFGVYLFSSGNSLSKFAFIQSRAVRHCASLGGSSQLLGTM